MKHHSLIVIAGLAALAGPALVVAAPDSDTDRSHPALFVKDSAITAAIKTKLAAEKLSTMKRIHVDTDKDGAVWLSGYATSQKDADRATAIARDTSGVTSVKSDVTVKKDD